VRNPTVDPGIYRRLELAASTLIPLLIVVPVSRVPLVPQRGRMEYRGGKEGYRKRVTSLSIMISRYL
jgi:hypothetical protein